MNKMKDTHDNNQRHTIVQHHWSKSVHCSLRKWTGSGQLLLSLMVYLLLSPGLSDGKSSPRQPQEMQLEIIGDVQRENNVKLQELNADDHQHDRHSHSYPDNDHLMFRHLKVAKSLYHRRINEICLSFHQ